MDRFTGELNFAVIANKFSIEAMEAMESMDAIVVMESINLKRPNP